MKDDDMESFTQALRVVKAARELWASHKKDGWTEEELVRALVNGEYCNVTLTEDRECELLLEVIKLEAMLEGEK